MANQSEYFIWNQALGGGLAAMLFKLREDEELSWRLIARALYEVHGIDITDDTVNRWYDLAAKERDEQRASA